MTHRVFSRLVERYRLGALHRLEWKRPRITEEGRRAIIRYLDSTPKFPTTDGREVYIDPTLPSWWDWGWVTDPKRGVDYPLQARYPGKFTTRIAKFFREEGLIVPQEVVQKVGEIAKAHLAPSAAVEFDLVDHFDWEDGDFGDAGSCFWCGRMDKRLQLELIGALAIRFYDREDDGYPTRGIGRAWLIPCDGPEAIIVANAYGRYSLHHVGVVVSELTGWPYRRAEVLVNGYAHGPLMYFNGHSIAVGPEATAALLDARAARRGDGLPPRIWLEWPRLAAYCKLCRSAVPIAEAVECEPDLFVCKPCLERRPRCTACGRPIVTRPVYVLLSESGEDMPYCRPCADALRDERAMAWCDCDRLVARELIFDVYRSYGHARAGVPSYYGCPACREERTFEWRGCAYRTAFGHCLPDGTWAPDDVSSADFECFGEGNPEEDDGPSGAELAELEDALETAFEEYLLQRAAEQEDNATNAAVADDDIIPF